MYMATFLSIITKHHMTGVMQYNLLFTNVNVHISTSFGLTFPRYPSQNTKIETSQGLLQARNLLPSLYICHDNFRANSIYHLLQCKIIKEQKYPQVIITTKSDCIWNHNGTVLQNYSDLGQNALRHHNMEYTCNTYIYNNIMALHLFGQSNSSF